MFQIRRYGLSRSSKSEKDAEKEAKKKALAAGLSPAGKGRSDTMDSEEALAQEEKRIQALMKGMSAMEIEEVLRILWREIYIYFFNLLIFLGYIGAVGLC